MEHFDDLTAPPVVGRTYLARCVFVPERYTEETIGRRLCRRPWPEYPAVEARKITGILERLYPQPLPASMRCPHRGINLASVPERDGMITCPGHGLSWCAATGRPVCAADGRYRDC